MTRGEGRGAEYLVLIIFGIVLPFILGSSLLVFNDGDVRWHIASGEWILDRHALPKTDPFSFTYAGQKWVTIEWLGGLIYAAAFRAAGFAGVAAVVSLALVALHLIVIDQARRYVGPWGVVATVVLMDLTLVPMMLARPHLLAWPLLALWIVVLLRARKADRAPPIAVAFIMVPWANLHGSWAIGAVIAAFIAFDHAAAQNWDRRVVAGWIKFGLISALAALLTPHGLGGFLHPLSIMTMETLPLIVEWRPSDPSRTPFFFVSLAITAILVAWRGLHLRPAMAVLLVLLAAMALGQMRHQSILAICAALLLPEALVGGAARRSLSDGPRRAFVVAGLLAILALAVFRAARPLEPAENGANPKTAIRALSPELRKQPGLNGYSFGGPLILEGVKVYIDGRADLYGDEFVQDYRRILDGDRAAFDAANRQYDFQWTLLPPRYELLIARLDQDPEWRRIYSDPIAVVHRRTSRPSASGTPQESP